MATLAFRVSETLKTRVENLMDRMFPGGGHGSGPVLESYIEKGLREDERLYNPGAAPGSALVDIWTRMHDGRLPSHEQWTFLAQKVHAAFMFARRTYARPETVQAIGQTFLRIHQAVDLDQNANFHRYLLGNTPGRALETDRKPKTPAVELIEATERYLASPICAVITNEFFSRNLEVIGTLAALTMSRCSQRLFDQISTPYFRRLSPASWRIRMHPTLSKAGTTVRWLRRKQVAGPMPRHGTAIYVRFCRKL